MIRHDENGRIKQAGAKAFAHTDWGQSHDLVRAVDVPTQTRTQTQARPNWRCRCTTFAAVTGCTAMLSLLVRNASWSLPYTSVLQLPNKLHLTRCQEEQCSSGRAYPRGATHSVDIVRDGRGRCELNYPVDAGQVQAPCCYVLQMMWPAAMTSFRFP